MLQQLRESRELDQNNFRDAAEMTVKWKMGQVEKQLEDLRGELKIKRDECGQCNQQLQAANQQLAREQETARGNHAKLQEALGELKRMRDSNSKFDSTAKEYQTQCATLEHELRAAGERGAELSREVCVCARACMCVLAWL
jgi:chromosome segregation ATPase